MADRTPKQEMTIMARAFATVMGREFVDDGRDAPIGAWYIERADTQKPLYRLAERSAHGGNHHPVTSSAATARELSHALYFARLAVGMDRSQASADELGYPYRGEDPSGV